MAPKLDSSEAIVLNYVNEENRPLNSQNVADALQKYNLKKASIQKSLDSLADSGRISFKEYGKQKIYVARQDQFHIPTSEELSAMSGANAALQEELRKTRKQVAEAEAEMRGLESTRTLHQIREERSRVGHLADALEAKLEKLRSGARLVDPQDRKAVRDMLTHRLGEWRKRKRMFRDVWDPITENSPKDPKLFKEDLSLEFDEDVPVSLSDYLQLR